MAGAGGACGTWGGIKEMHAGFWWCNLKERGNFQDLGLHGTMVLKLIQITKLKPNKCIIVII
jgi:hypothetical protein